MNPFNAFLSKANNSRVAKLTLKHFKQIYCYINHKKEIKRWAVLLHMKMKNQNGVPDT